MYSFPSLSSLTDKLVNCMCGIGSGLVVWMSTPEVYCGRFNKFMFPKFIKSVKRIAVPYIKQTMISSPAPFTLEMFVLINFILSSFIRLPHNLT